MSNSFSPVVLQRLNAAGWHEGRRVEVDGYTELFAGLFPAARDVLCEFGGLHIGECGPGKQCATSDVHLEPSLASHLSSELRQYERILATQFFPLGEIHRGHGYLLINAEGRTYLLNDTLIPFAASFSQALEKLLLGLLPDTQGAKD